jgi:hypothetical protein
MLPPAVGLGSQQPAKQIQELTSSIHRNGRAKGGKIQQDFTKNKVLERL